MATHQRKLSVVSAFQFDYLKAAQATACLLRRQKNRQMNYHRLLKLLYVADRECIRESGRPIIGGRYLAMDRGPLHSAMLDLIKGSDMQSPTWVTMFRLDHFDLEMISDPGSGELCKQETEVLNRVATQYEEYDDYELGEKMNAFPELESNRPEKGASKTIPLDDVINAVGRGQDLEAILRDAREKAIFDRVFSE